MVATLSLSNWLARDVRLECVAVVLMFRQLQEYLIICKCSEFDTGMCSHSVLVI